jgi:hypothetical protein
LKEKLNWILENSVIDSDQSISMEKMNVEIKITSEPAK